MRTSGKPVRSILKQYEACAIMWYASFGIALIVLMVIQIPLGLIIGHSNSVLTYLIYFISAPIAQFIMSYRDGRRNYQFKLWRLLIALALTIATQVLLAIIIGGHAVYFSGPAIVWDEYLLRIYNPVSVHTRTILDAYEWLLMFASDLLVYVPTIILGAYLGCQKRIKEFNESNEPEPVNEVE